MDGFTIDWTHFGAAITAVGALGVASFGLVESAGKIVVWTRFSRGRFKHFGLPYAGLKSVMSMLQPFGLALQCAYGTHYEEIIAQKYYAGRSTGDAPDIIRGT